MKQLLIAVALLGPLVLSAGPAARAQDQIHHFDRKTQTNLVTKGTITEETPAKVTYRKAGGKPADLESIPAADITDIEYLVKDDDKFEKLDWNKAHSKLRQARAAAKPAERKKLLETALELLRELAPKVTDKKPLNRDVQFSIAEALALQSEDDPKQLDAAVDALQKFRKDFGDGWQLVKATKLHVRLLEQKGDEAGAQAVYAELTDNEAAPKEVRQEFGLLRVRYLLRKGKHDEAATKARAVQKGMAADDPQAMKLTVYLAACDIAGRKYDAVEKELKAVLEGGADNDVKALARNTLGDYYRAQGQGDKAFWEYLWVDVHYNQDREELARALYNLSRLFADVRKDPVRAKECLERLCDEKQFGGAEYHRKALAEKSPGGNN
ncbi:MAG TPA: hypothetical protein VKA46_37670 [Gemmataceae bacterium]|nr:hypothetical protein [Gemmataceae bacterium]